MHAHPAALRGLPRQRTLRGPEAAGHRSIPGEGAPRTAALRALVAAVCHPRGPGVVAAPTGARHLGGAVRARGVHERGGDAGRVTR